MSPLFHALTPLYPGKHGLEAVRPDLLGEALVAQALLLPVVAQPLLGAVLGKESSQAVRRQALTVLSRLATQRFDIHEILLEALTQNLSYCCRDLVEVGIETPGPLPSLAEAAFSQLPPASKSQVAGLLEPLLSDESIQCAGLSCLISQFLLEKAEHRWHKNQKKHNQKGTEDKAEYARRLKIFAVCLFRVGKNDAALEQAGAAEQLTRQLAEKNPGRFEPDLAGSLNNFANLLSEVGKSEEALESAEKSLIIYQRLAVKNPDRFDPGLAMSLNNLANRLSEMEKSEEALESAKKSLIIRQRLAVKNPDRFDPDFAMSLNNLTNCLSEVGKSEEALESAQKALVIYQRLAKENPDRFNENFHNTTCLVRFLGWLTDSKVFTDYNASLIELPTDTPDHRRSLSQLYVAFVHACLSAKQDNRSLLFSQILSLGNTLTPAASISARPYWLCAAIWSSEFSSAAVVETNWQPIWTKYVDERHGNIPYWLAEVSRRLEFSLPPG